MRWSKIEQDEDVRQRQDRCDTRFPNSAFPADSLPNQINHPILREKGGPSKERFLGKTLSIHVKNEIFFPQLRLLRLGTLRMMPLSVRPASLIRG